MKTDETNIPRDPAQVKTRVSVSPIGRAMPGHAKSASEREQDALDTWRDTLQGKDSQDRPENPTPSRTASPDPVQVHGFDLDASTPETRTVIEAFSAELSRLHKVLEATEARLAWSEDARRHDPETGLLRRDALLSEVRHLESLDQQEDSNSDLAILIVDRFDAFRRKAGRDAAEKAMARLGAVLADISDPAEPAGRIGDGEFLVLLTGLAGDAALERLVALAQQLCAAIDENAETVGLRPGRLMVGRSRLLPGEDPLLAVGRADRDCRKNNEPDSGAALA